MKTAWIAVLAAAAIGFAGAVFLWLGPGAEEATSAERLAEGRALYGAHCAACHGANLEGEPNWRTRRADGTLPAPPHDETGHTWHHPDSQLFDITKQGTAAFAPAGYKTNMLGFADSLSDDQIRAVLDYIKSRWPEKIRAAQADITRRTESAQ